ncbi:hypothetical protein CYY_007478, partial [Polysphondylium violaceum]
MTTELSAFQINKENVLQFLNGLLDPNLNKQYESHLDVYCFNQNGFGLTLAQIGIDTSINVDIRQFSFIILKKFVQERWEGKQIPSDAEKAEIRHIISPLLADPSPKIRTAIAMCIGKIGVYDWPAKWPSLLDDLMKCINNPGNMNLFSGAMRCLEILCCDESDHENIAQIMISSFSVLNALLKRIDLEPLVHIKITQVFKKIAIYTTTNMDVNKTLFKTLLPFINEWGDIFALHLEAKIDPKFINEMFTIQANLIETISMLYNDFQSSVSPFIERLFSSVWALFKSSYPYYEQIEIFGEDHTPKTLEEGVFGIDKLVSSLLEFLTLVINKKKYKGIFEPIIRDIIYQVILYMKMPNDWLDLWETDINQFLDQEDDHSYNPRVISVELLTSILASYPAARGAMVELVKFLFVKASEKQNPNWWRYREVCLFILTTYANEFIAIAKKNPQLFDATQLLQNQLPLDFAASDKQEDEEYTGILKGRSLTCAGAYGRIVDSSISVQYLNQAVQVISSSTSPLPLKLAAIKSMGTLIESLPLEMVNTGIPKAIQVTCSFLSQLSEDSLLLVLDALLLFTKIDRDITGSMESVLTPSLTAVWINFANDQLICETINDIFRVMASCPKSYPGILKNLLPTLNIILCAYDKSLYIGIADSTVDLLGIVVSKLDSSIIDEFLLRQLLDPLLNILVSIYNDESSRKLARAALLSVIPFIYKLSTQVLVEYKPVLENKTLPPQSSLADCLFFIFQSYIVQSELISGNAIPILKALISKHTSIINNHLANINNLLIDRLANCKLSTTKEALCVVFARLFLIYKQNALDYLFTVPSPDPEFASALEFILSEWNKSHPDIQTYLDTNISLLALVSLFDYSTDKRFQSIQVHSTPITNEKSSRNINKKLKEKWTKCNLYEKATVNIYESYKLMLLDEKEAEAERKKKESAANGEYDDDLYEEVEVEEEEEEEEEYIPEEQGEGFAPAAEYQHILDSIDFTNNENDDDTDNFEVDTDILEIFDKEDQYYNVKLR